MGKILSTPTPLATFLKVKVPPASLPCFTARHVPSKSCNLVFGLPVFLSFSTIFWVTRIVSPDRKSSFCLSSIFTDEIVIIIFILKFYGRGFIPFYQLSFCLPYFCLNISWLGETFGLDRKSTRLNSSHSSI